MPLVYHNPDFGRLFIRSSWEDTAKWFGYFDGVIQVFEDGHLSVLNPQLAVPPIELKEAVVCFGATARKFTVNLDEEDAVFLIGLQPRRVYQVEIDDEEVYEAADRSRRHTGTERSPWKRSRSAHPGSGNRNCQLTVACESTETRRSQP